MFSWGKSSHSKSSSGDQNSSSIVGAYPASVGSHRRNSSSSSNSNATTVQGRMMGFTRADHIASYLNDPTLRPSTRRISKDDTMFDTVFQTRNGHALILRTYLKPSPDSSCPNPVMSLVGIRTSHPWLDSQMRVIGFSPIINNDLWIRYGQKLGQVVNTVVQHLQMNPPEEVEFTDKTLQDLNANLRRNQNGTVTQPPPPPPEPTLKDSLPPPPDYGTVLNSQKEESYAIPIPEIPSRFAEVDDMSTSEMKSLKNDEEFQIFWKNISSVATLHDLQASIFNGNVETAQANLKSEQELADIYAEVEALQRTLADKLELFEVESAKANKLSIPTSKSEVVKELRKAKKESYDESESMASKWVDEGTEDVEEFIDQFLETRCIYHERSAKIERLLHS